MQHKPGMSTRKCSNAETWSDAMSYWAKAPKMTSELDESSGVRMPGLGCQGGIAQD
jgi:hypothetical protein